MELLARVTHEYLTQAMNVSPFLTQAKILCPKK